MLFRSLTHWTTREEQDVGQRNSGEPGRVPASRLHFGGEDRMASCSCGVGSMGVKEKKSAEAARSKMSLFFLSKWRHL